MADVHRSGVPVPFLCRLLYPYTHSLVGLWSSGRIHLSMDGGTVRTFLQLHFRLHHAEVDGGATGRQPDPSPFTEGSTVACYLRLHRVPDFISLTRWGGTQGIVECLDHSRQTESAITKSFARRRLSSVPSTAVDVLIMSVLVYGLYP